MDFLENIFVYRITHLQNISHVLQHGITHLTSPNRNPNYIAIGDSSLISSRASFLMPNGTKLGKYIPFYFGVRMPMLYVIQNGFNGVKPVSPKNIVYCVSSVAAIIKSGVDFVFTDGHAVDGLSSYYLPKDVHAINSIVDFNAVKELYWKKDTDLDLKRRKEAEFLINGDLPSEAVIGFITYNQDAAKSIAAIPEFSNKKLRVEPKYYF